ncbi:MAG: hypothetical protein WCL32_14985 [Planctomycetota bacterium]
MMSTCFKSIAMLFALSAAAPSAWASSATFAIRAEGIKLVEGEGTAENGKDVLVFRATAPAGKAFTLTAQGIVLPRGGKPTPGEPEAGQWTFDEKLVKKLALEKKDDKTTISIRVEPTTAGVTRFRFIGTILGYERTIHVLVDVQE